MAAVWICLYDINYTRHTRIERTKSIKTRLAANSMHGREFVRWFWAKNISAANRMATKIFHVT